MKHLLLAIQFLTIIPVKVKGDVTEKDMVSSAIFFPVAGACQGLVMVVAAVLSIKLFSPEVVCGLVVLAHVISNSGFDLDGLADTFDALSVKSSGDAAADIKKRLAVMKESTVGASGAIAITITLLLKFLLVWSLIRILPTGLFFSTIFAMAVFSKWVTLPAMLHGVSARSDGLGRIFTDNITTGHVLFSSVILFAMGFISYGISSKFGQLAGHAAMLVVLSLFLYGFSILAVRFFSSRFGGITGDNFGAMSEISEILFLMGTYIWSRHYIS